MTNEKDLFVLDISKNVLAFNGKPMQVSDTPDEKPHDATVRDYLLGLLASNLPLKGAKESFIVHELGLQIGDETKDKIELSARRLATLQKWVQSNKANGQNGKDVPLFSGNVHAQLMLACGLTSEDI